MFITLPLPSWNTAAGGSLILASLALAGKELGDGRADAARLVRVDLGELLDRLGRGLRIVLVLEERAAQDHQPGGPGTGDEVAALRHRTVVARREDEILAARAAIRARQAKIDDPAEPHVVQSPQHLGRHLEHHGPFGDVDEAQEVHGVGVGGEEQRLGIHQLGEDEDFVVLDAGVEKASASGDQADTLHRVDERVVGVREVDVVVGLFQRGLARRAVLEFERADARLDFVRRGDRRRDLGGGEAWQCQCDADGCKDTDLFHSPILFSWLSEMLSIYQRDALA